MQKGQGISSPPLVVNRAVDLACCCNCHADGSGTFGDKHTHEGKARSRLKEFLVTRRQRDGKACSAALAFARDGQAFGRDHFRQSTSPFERGVPTILF